MLDTASAMRDSGPITPCIEWAPLNRANERARVHAFWHSNVQEYLGFVQLLAACEMIQHLEFYNVSAPSSLLTDNHIASPCVAEAVSNVTVGGTYVVMIIIMPFLCGPMLCCLLVLCAIKSYPGWTVQKPVGKKTPAWLTASTTQLSINNRRAAVSLCEMGIGADTFPVLVRKRYWTYRPGTDTWYWYPHWSPTSAVVETLPFDSSRYSH